MTNVKLNTVINRLDEATQKLELYSNLGESIKNKFSTFKDLISPKYKSDYIPNLDRINWLQILVHKNSPSYRHQSINKNGSPEPFSNIPIIRIPQFPKKNKEDLIIYKDKLLSTIKSEINDENRDDIERTLAFIFLQMPYSKKDQESIDFMTKNFMQFISKIPYYILRNILNKWVEDNNRAPTVNDIKVISEEKIKNTKESIKRVELLIENIINE